MKPQFREGYYTGTDTGGRHRLVYSDWGPEEGFPVIAVHGLTGNGHDFDWLAPALAEDGRRVIAVDMPGRGRSDFLKNTDDYCYRQYLGDLNGLLAHLGLAGPKSVDWIGVSMGGLLGIILAAQPHSPLRRLVLNDIGPYVPQDQLNLIAQYIAQPYAFPDLKAMEDFMRQTRGLSWGPVTDEQWKAMARNNARTLPEGGVTYAFDPGIADIFKKEPVGAADLWPLWDSLACPALVLRGADSLIFPQKTADEMKTRGPGARGLMTLEVIPGCGHVPSLMAPEQIALVHRWLEQL